MAKAKRTPKKPKVAVWKFASCDGCQLSLLDCEDELLAVAGAVDIANFAEASSAVQPGPVRHFARRGLDHDAARRRADPRDPAFVETPDHHRGLRHGGRHPGVAELQERQGVHVHRVRLPAVHRHPREIHGDLGPREGRFRTAGLPDQQVPAARSGRVVSPGEEAQHPGVQRLRRVQAARGRLRSRGVRPALPRPGDPGGVQRALPVVPPGLFRVFGPKETPNTSSLSTWWLKGGVSPEELVRLFRSFNAGADAFRKESEIHER